MPRIFVAGCLLFALGSIASSQPGVTPDEALSPMEILMPGAVREAPASVAKPEADKKAKAGGTSETAKTGEGSTDYLTQCLRDWDAGTHMTKREWARTCRRVASSRAKFLREQEGK